MIPLASRLWMPLLFLLLPGWGLLTPARAETVTEELRSVSAWLGELQAGLQRELGIKRIYIGGGSALNIIDHVYQGTPLSFRDLDVFVVLDRPVTEELAEKLGESLQSKTLGKYSAADLRPRPRANPELKLPQRNQYNAGYGFFFRRPDGSMLDLSIFHSERDLGLNGIFDIDRVKIPLEFGSTLESVVSTQWKGVPAASLGESKLLVDEHNGYVAWLAKKPEILNWAEVERDPAQNSIRVIRSFSKAGLKEIPKKTAEELRTIVARSTESNEFQIIRNLIKLSSSKDASSELKSLAAIGMLTKLSPALQALVAESTESQIDSLMEGAAKKKGGFERLAALVGQLDSKARIPLIKLMYRAEPALLMENLAGLINGARGPPLRVGYFSGEFAPFHEGHLGVAQEPLNRQMLDLVFVIPTPFSPNGGKTTTFSRVEWRERIRMSELGSQKDSRIMVWPDVRIAPTEPGRPDLGGLFRTLQDKVGSPTLLTHIAGGDSLFRIVERNLLQSDPRPRIIVERYGVPTLKEASDPANQITVLKRFGHHTISATQILHQIAATGTAENVSADVLEFVKATPRYQRIIRDLRRAAADLKGAADPIREKKQPNFVWRPLYNSDGHWFGVSPLPDAMQMAMVEELVRGKNGSVWIHLDPQKTPEATITAWKKAVKELGLSEVRVTTEEASLPHKRRVEVRHSGEVIHSIEAMAGEIEGGERYLLFETPDNPLSPLLRHPNIPVILMKPPPCWEAFQYL